MVIIFLVNLLNHEALNRNPKHQDGSLTHLNQQHEKRLATFTNSIKSIVGYILE
jgi:hypothetical protein